MDKRPEAILEDQKLILPLTAVEARMLEKTWPLSIGLIQAYTKICITFAFRLITMGRDRLSVYLERKALGEDVGQELLNELNLSPDRFLKNIKFPSHEEMEKIFNDFERGKDSA